MGNQASLFFLWLYDHALLTSYVNKAISSQAEKYREALDTDMVGAFV